MTPKEKAKELFKQYYSYLKANLMNDKEALEDAKECAVIAVDEILKSTPSYPYDIQFDLMPHFRSMKYWYEVKQEIEKL